MFLFHAHRYKNGDSVVKRISKFICLVISILLLSTPVFASSQNLGSTSVGEESMQEKVTRIVTVGYAVDNEEILFSGKSNEEINNFLNKKCREILEKPYNALSSSISNKDSYEMDGLIVSVIDPNDSKNNFYSDGNLGGCFILHNKISPNANDEVALHRVFRYAVGFEVGNMGTVYGNYETH